MGGYMGKRLQIPNEALFILKTLNNAGFEAYFVGGCVRDALLGRKANDWDIATGALPMQVKSLFPRTIDTGLKHGTVTVLVNDLPFETTTYRIEGGYSDSRRPDWVEFTSSLEADLSRRDFTMNAIAYHPDRGFIDPFGGITDISNRIIRTVGQPAERYSEDALRMLRAVRFSAQLQFTLEPSTLAALKECNSLIAHISYERIRDELVKMLMSPDPERMHLLHDTGLLAYILPELDQCFCMLRNNRGNSPRIPGNTCCECSNSHDRACCSDSIGLHNLRAISLADRIPAIRWALLFHDTGIAMAEAANDKSSNSFLELGRRSAILASEALKRLRLDSKTIGIMQKLVEYHDYVIEPEPAAVRRAAARIGEDIFELLLKVKRADLMAGDKDSFRRDLENLELVKQLFDDARQSGHCMGLDSLAVNGRDLMELGLKAGPELGMALHKLLDAVIENPSLNTRERLIDLALSIINSSSN